MSRADKLVGANPAIMARTWHAASPAIRARITRATGYTGPEEKPISIGKQLRRRSARHQPPNE